MGSASTRRVVLGVLGILCAAVHAPAETIYATTGLEVFRFDSASPGSIELVMPFTGDLTYSDQMSLEFDPAMSALYGFASYDCQILCPGPPPIDVVAIDTTTGETSFVNWPGFPYEAAGSGDKDVHPVSRDLRMLGGSGPGIQNLRYALDSLQLFVDSPLDDSTGSYRGIAHTPPASDGTEVETFAVRMDEEFALELVRLGGPAGRPPASSGEVTLIGQIPLAAWVWAFDISPQGNAYLLVEEFGPGIRTGGPGPQTLGGSNRLYSIDLKSAAVQDLGAVAQPGTRPVTGIAVAPEGSVVEVPTLRSTTLAVLSWLLAVAALARLAARRRGATQPR